jgi:nicotinamidase-related amidase
MEPLERPAVLICDMQNDFLKGEFAPPDAAERYGPAIGNCQRLVAAARARGWPVLFSRIAFRPGYPDANPHSPARQRGDLLLLGTWGGDVVDELAPRPAEVVITKKRTSVFFATELDLVLRGMGVRTLVLGGIATHLAVESTARDAHAHDYEVCVVSDASTALQAEFQEPSLRTVAAFFGRVHTTDEVIAALGG